MQNDEGFFKDVLFKTFPNGQWLNVKENWATAWLEPKFKVKDLATHLEKLGFEVTKVVLE